MSRKKTNNSASTSLADLLSKANTLESNKADWLYSVLNTPLSELEIKHIKSISTKCMLQFLLGCDTGAMRASVPIKKTVEFNETLEILLSQSKMILDYIESIEEIQNNVEARKAHTFDIHMVLKNLLNATFDIHESARTLLLLNLDEQCIYFQDRFQNKRRQ